MDNATAQQQPVPASATVTITEMPQGTSIEVQFNTSFQRENPKLAHMLAIRATDELRRFLNEQFEDSQESLHVLQRGKTH